jgi:hypothetical protein
MTTADDVLRSLPPPPKNMVGKDGQKIALLIATWISECAGKCTVAQLTQEDINAVFWGWIKKGRYADMVMNHMVKKLIKAKRPKQPQAATQETRARQVLNAAAKLQGRIAVITGGKIIEKGEEAGDSRSSLAEFWKQNEQKQRVVVNEMMEDIERQILLVNKVEVVDEEIEEPAQAAE